MNCTQANKISISAYLSSIGIYPKRNLRYYSFYLSPFRQERTASFKVDHRLNLWIDFGDSNSGGTLVDLVLKLNPSFAVEDALSHLSDLNLGSLSPHLHTPLLEAEIKPKISVTSTRPIGTNKVISDYLISRKISLSTASNFCKEVYFEINDKNYFGVGNENRNGWSIRNKYWKGCSGQGISFFPGIKEKNVATLSVFEGIFDLMSYVQLNKTYEKAQSFIVLNSLSNIKEALPIIREFGTVNLYLDRDVAGMKATKRLMEANVNCIDKSKLYTPHKDLNEKLVKERKPRIRR
ncbi:toprim domain-containing protein [Belliella sp. DSM 111904]|uniref:Toprim domain-containing protein n=1 Tax=Belliella filtrata TaxID=2923435 RepID=A0ABS9V3Z1_9BACT|nr:toprim domain-containing protein [Belliella filtrata]MCH7410910.1 toprim domain-containing protein [Belliella filtrata]